MNGRAVDGRWVGLLLLAGYLGWLLAGGSAEDFSRRWKQLGVDVRPVRFVDLYVFPAARAELAAGGDPAVANPTDPMRRPYNYPRAWLAFMRFPADPGVISVVGVGLAAAALLALLACWGRLTPGQGIVGGLLLCSPAVMLGVERGNTDQLVFCLVAAGILLGWEQAGVGRKTAPAVLWLAAAVLKLYPALAFAAWWRRPWRATARTLVLPAVLLGGYLFFFRAEVLAALRATGSGWVISYGAGVPAKALVQAVDYFYAVKLDGQAWRLGFTLSAFALIGLAAWRGARLGGLALPAGPAAAREWRGFQVAALIYVGTFLAGDNFDYRLLFLLPAFPALWTLARAGGRGARRARIGLVCLLLATGINFLMAGWAGFVISQVAGWTLGAVLAALLAAERAGSSPAAAPVTARPG
jgi:hypothetical protein